MTYYFKRLLIDHWERKCVSLILAVVIWFVVSHSLTVSKTFEGVAVRVINIAPNKTVENLQPNGLLLQNASITITGKRSNLEELNPSDIEIVVDAQERQGDWIATVSKKNLVSLNPDLDFSKAILRLSPLRLPIKLTSLVTEKIPVVISKPIGEAPRDYQFLDVWPYHLTLTVSGPENTIQKLKEKGLKLVFNLNQISRADLESLQNISGEEKTDEVSFPIPEEWKKVSIPGLSDRPIEINDPQAKWLKIDFIKSDLHPITKPIPLRLFYPPEFSASLNPGTYSVCSGSAIKSINGISVIERPLYAKGVSRHFLEIVQDMLEISVILSPKGFEKSMDWSVQFINARQLEEKYITSWMNHQGASEDTTSAYTKKREDYLRNRFRNYMNHLELYRGKDAKLNLSIELEKNSILIDED